MSDPPKPKIDYPLTAFHDPSDRLCMLVSIRSELSLPRTLVKVVRPLPQLIARCIKTGTKKQCDASRIDFVPAHGQIVDGVEYFAIPPDWRVSLPLHIQLPSRAENWLRCMAYFVWGELGVAAVCDVVHGTVHVFWNPQDAINTIDADILFVCTQEAERAIECTRKSMSWISFASRFPVICNPDQFATATSLDRPPNTWYHTPFFFCPTQDEALSLHMRDTYANALVAHRCAWIRQLGIVQMMFSLSVMTKMPLHEVANPHQTQIADALIEQTWMEAPFEFDAPSIVRDEIDYEDTMKRFKGASVLDARLGLDQISLTAMPDVSSLYPNTVIEYLSDEYPLYARLFQKMLHKRSIQSDPLLAESTKVCTNSVFGSRKYGRYRCPRLAEQITECGRKVQSESLDQLHLHLPRVRVIGGDTDSLVLTIPPFVDPAQFIPSIVRVLNGNRKHTVYKADVALFSSIFFVNNKCWAGVRADTGQVVTRGLAMNRSSVPRFVLQSHMEWIDYVLRDESFNTSRTVREEWIRRRADILRKTQHLIADLVVWPKPTRVHANINRAYVVVVFSQKHVPYCKYMQLGKTQLPVDVDYLVKIYFESDVNRQHALLLDETRTASQRAGTASV